MRYLLTIMLSLLSLSAYADMDDAGSYDADTSLIVSNMAMASTTPIDSIADSVPTPKLNIIQKVIKYFDDTNKTPSNKNVDFSLIGGPAYSSDTKLSVGILGAMLYNTGHRDSVTSQSNATLYTVFSITGYYNIGLKGVHFTPSDRWRGNYKLSFFSMPTYFWGIGYDVAHFDENKTKYLQLNAEVKASFDYQLFKNGFLGPIIHFNYMKAKDADDYSLWDGECKQIFNYGLGANFYFDNRDCITAPHSGWYLGLIQRFFPRFFFNKNAFSSTEITVNHYFGAWRDATIALNLHGLFTYGNTPWTMLPFIGGSYTMRGYYEGRYRDKNAIDVTMELRQHIWHRNSAVIWIGAANVFPKLGDLQARKILPNFGIGYRWEFKKNVNIRLDFGFGKGETGIIFNINEAF